MKNNIKVFRAIHNLTQENLAITAHTSRQTIIAIEKEKYTPSLVLAFKLARIFKVSLEELFQYEEIKK